MQRLARRLCCLHLLVWLLPLTHTACPAASSGRVLCMQQQVCPPGVVLPSAGCGPASSYACCLKDAGVMTAADRAFNAYLERSKQAVIPDQAPARRPHPHRESSSAVIEDAPPAWNPHLHPQWEGSPVTQSTPAPAWEWITPAPSAGELLPQPWQDGPSWNRPPEPTPPPPLQPTPTSQWEFIPTGRPPSASTTSAPRGEPLFQCGQVQRRSPPAGVRPAADIDERSALAAAVGQLPSRLSSAPWTQFVRQLDTLYSDRGRRQRRAPRQLLGAVGGEDADRALWPWAALLGRRSAAGAEAHWVCGAVVIARRHLLTAAHCVRGAAARSLVIRLGEYDVTSATDGRTVDLTPSQVVVHPQYTAKQNDIALLRVTEPIVFNAFIQPVCLPPPDRDAHTLVGAAVLLAGWGFTQFMGSTAHVLQQVELLVVPPEQCENHYRQLVSYGRDFPGGFQGTKLCAAGADGAEKDACNGDSGGPLVQRRPDGVFQLVGVVSAGVGCGNPQYPGLYTRVSAYVEWIDRNVY